MKKKIVFCLSLLAAAFCALAYKVGIHEFSFPASGATNGILLDVEDTSQVGLNIYYTCALGNGTVESITLTNVGTSNSFAFTNVLSAVTNAFIFTNILPASNNLTLQATNSFTYQTTAGGTNNFVTFNTNYFPFTNYIGVQTFSVVFSNFLGFSNSITTNIAYAGATNAFTFTSVNGGNTFTGLATNTFTITNSGSTNVSLVTELNYVTFTNNPNLNFNYIAANTNSTVSTTNLYAALQSVYGLSYYFAYGNPTNISLTTPLSPANTATIGASLGTLTLTTNVMAGSLVLSCSNSYDGLIWNTDSLHSLSFVLSTNGTNFWTNFSGTNIGCYQNWQYTVQNASTNNAAIPYFKLTHGRKQGL